MVKVSTEWTSEERLKVIAELALLLVEGINHSGNQLRLTYLSNAIYIIALADKEHLEKNRKDFDNVLSKK